MTGKMERLLLQKGNQIIASNDDSMVGEDIDKYNVIKKIKETGASGKIIHADSKHGVHIIMVLWERGRDYYVYVYMPERNVFRQHQEICSIHLLPYVCCTCMSMPLENGSGIKV